MVFSFFPSSSLYYFKGEKGQACEKREKKVERQGEGKRIDLNTHKKPKKHTKIQKIIVILKGNYFTFPHMNLIAHCVFNDDK